MNNLYDYLIKQDLLPKLIGKFKPNTQWVQIEIIDNNNLPLKLKKKMCVPIANTLRWSWSIRDIPNGKYMYIMTSDKGEVFSGDFCF